MYLPCSNVEILTDTIDLPRARVDWNNSSKFQKSFPLFIVELCLVVFIIYLLRRILSRRKLANGPRGNTIINAIEFYLRPYWNSFDSRKWNDTNATYLLQNVRKFVSLCYLYVPPRTSGPENLILHFSPLLVLTRKRKKREKKRRESGRIDFPNRVTYRLTIPPLISINSNRNRTCFIRANPPEAIENYRHYTR